MSTRRAAPPNPAQALREAFVLHEIGVAMMRARLSREHPAASAEVVESMLREWLEWQPPMDESTFRQVSWPRHPN